METTHAPTTTRTDPRELFGTAVVLAAEVIGGVRPDQMADPTPCTELDIRGLLAHMLMVLDRVAALGRGDDPFALAQPGAVVDDAWPQAWAEAARAARASWSEESVLERTMVLPWAQEPGAGILAGYVSEITVHTWDLATATGARPAFDAEVVAASLAAIERMLPVEGRGGDFVPFDDAVAVPDAAEPIDRLVAYTGRRP